MADLVSGESRSKNWLNYKTRIRTINKINKNDLRYMAGLMDGEGCIGLQTVGSIGKQNLHPQITITNTNKEVLDWVFSVVGKGRVEEHKKELEYHKQCYVWRINGRFAVQISKALLPYLKIKRIQAETLIQFEKTMQLKEHRHRLSPEIKQERNRLKAIMSGLNKRGI